MWRKVLAAVALALVVAPAVAPGQARDAWHRGGEQPEPQRDSDVIRSANYVDTPITTIFQMVSDMTDWSIVMSPEVSKQPPKVNIWIKNLPPDEVLRQVARVAGLAVERDGQTVNVMTYDEYARAYGVEKRVVTLNHADAPAVAEMLKPFTASTDQSRIVADQRANKIILLVPSPLMESLLNLIEMLDVPLSGDAMEVVRLTHLRSEQITPPLKAFLTQRIGDSTTRSESDGGAASDAGQEYLVRFMPVPKLNAIVLRGRPDDVPRVVDLIRQLDVAPDRRIRNYPLQHVEGGSALEVLRTLLGNNGGEEDATGPRLALSEGNRQLLVEGSEHQHEQVARALKALDQPLPPDAGGVRVYRLDNVTADEVATVLETLVAEEDEQTGRPVLRRDRAADEPSPSASEAPGGAAPGSASEEDVGGGTARRAPIRVTPMPQLNAVVIRATAREHEELDRLVEELDRPRDQVILEVTIISVRTDGDFRLGVEVGGQFNGEGTQGIGFSTFGIGRVDSETGAIRIAPQAPLGLNMAMFNAGDFSLVLNALRSVAEVRITSRPKLLVQDNEPAELQRLNQEPYEVTSQGENSTITSFGGFVDAGTALTVTPHISTGRWLRLKYQVALSSFGTRTAEQLQSNLPPPRRETQASGVVRVPADHMVVLGGLTGTRQDRGEERVPLVGSIPLIGELFKNRLSSNMQETIFIFIRPVLLRDAGFDDLLARSDQYARDVEEMSTYPENGLKPFVEEATEPGTEGEADDE